MIVDSPCVPTQHACSHAQQHETIINLVLEAAAAFRDEIDHVGPTCPAEMPYKPQPSIFAMLDSMMPSTRWCGRPASSAVALRHRSSPCLPARRSPPEVPSSCSASMRTTATGRRLSPPSLLRGATPPRGTPASGASMEAGV